MKTGKRILSIFLVALMLLTAAPLAGFVGLEVVLTAKAEPITGQCGENITFTIDKEAGTLYISGTGEMYANPSFSSRYWWAGETIQDIIIDGGITSIGGFSGLTSVTHVSIPSSVETILPWAFRGCISLASVTLPNNLKAINDVAFEDCSKLKNIKIPNSVTELGERCFSACTALLSVTIGTGINVLPAETFSMCSSLKSVVIPDNITSIKRAAFFECSNLESIFIPNSVKTIENAFTYCKKLKSIDIPDSVIELGSFYQCESLEKIVIPENVKKLVQNAFCNCSNLTEVVLPEKLEEIGPGAFQNCISLRTITIPDSLTKLGRQAFTNCEGLETVVIPKGVSIIDEFSFDGCTNLVDVTIRKGVERINSVAFSECKSLQKITIPNSVRVIERNAFKDCSSLTDVYFMGTIEEWNSIAEWNEIAVYNICLTNATIHCTDGSTEGISISLYYNTTDRPLIIENGSSSMLVATITPTNAANQTITWASSDPTVATVNQSGVVSSKREGITSITAQIETIEADTAQIGNIKAECKVIVRGNSTNNIYSLGEETYCYHNIDGGCCFGMALTSSMYYLGLLDRQIYGTNSDALYDCYTRNDKNEIMPTLKDWEIIHHFQNSQGMDFGYSATVAGTLPWLRITPHPQLISPLGSIWSISMQWRGVEADWYQVKNYVKNHQYDNKGSLIISFELSFLNDKNKKERHSHAVSFLRYEKVDGQDRIYTYDSNAPDEELYFYQDSDGSIKNSGYEKNYRMFSVNTISLEDVYKYANAAEKFKKAYAIYAKENHIVVENTPSFVLTGDFGSDTCQIMYEIPENLTEVRIVPLTDHAEFTYMGQVYHIDREDENTIGILKLAESEEDTGTLTIVNDPDNHVHIYDVDSFTAPTCSDAGEIICKCTRCGDTVTETVDALGHFDNDDDNICDDCGELMPAEEHTHEYTSTITTEPTCTTDGETTYTCSVCGDSYTEPIPATGNHVDDNNDGKCDTCGEKMTGGKHCKYCGKIHGGAFGWLVKFFHSIFAIFKR